MWEFRRAKKLINMSNKIYIVAHTNPDGDAIGSILAMYLALKTLNKDVHVIIPSYSKTFSFLEHLDEGIDKVEEDSYDLLIAFDSSDRTRLAISEEDFSKAKKVLMIDHHREKDRYGDVCVINAGKPAVCELLFDFLNYMKIKITREIATYLYVGIITDTGSLSYSNTTTDTFKAVSKLISTGINFSEIMYNINNSMTESKLKLIAYAIDRMEVYEGGKIRFAYVDYETIKSLGVDEEDAEGITNYLRSVKGTDVAIYVRGKSDGSLKVSLRASERVDVSEVAIKFGGGGHKRAAGYTMKEEFDIGKKVVIEEFKKLV
ncbi:MAG: bifunctional oligoribonuclease/PAP phosphatase NrnA [Clostridia bacterium]|nr:bifunctional oligoribonuclease/PAP phosphatase NrnA [Clostridia bacterium]